MHVAETFGQTKGGKSQRLALAEGGRLAVHSLSARNSRDRQAAIATAAAILSGDRSHTPVTAMSARKHKSKQTAAAAAGRRRGERLRGLAPNLLRVPRFSSKQRLKEKLLYAITTASHGFGLT